MIKCGSKWVDKYDQMLSSLNEVGDLANWSNMIEKDLKEVSVAV